MFQSYFKIALRALLRNKSYTFINIAGLAVGIAACLLIFLVVRFELSFDTFHPNKDRIYQVVSEYKRETTSYGPGIPFPVPQGLRVDYPQLEKVAAIFDAENGQINVLDDQKQAPEKKFKEERGLFFAEPQFFDIFDFPLLSGDAKTALAEPNTAILTQEVAEKYFGDWKNALGKSIRYDNKKDIYKITGVLKNIPANSDFPLKIVMSFKNLQQQKKDEFNDWGSTFSNSQCFILLPPGLSPEKFNAQMPTFVKKHKKPEDQNVGHLIRPLNEVHFDTRFNTFSGHTISKEMINGLALIGIFLIIIACVNFVNLATAQAINRSKEVGVRKALGSNRSQLTTQFLGETTLITVFAMLIAIIIAKIALPFLNQLLKLSVNFDVIESPTIILFLLIITVLVVLLSGFYPAMVLSGFNPVMALKSKITAKTVGGISLRRSLAVLQFTISQVLIIATFVVVSQMNYFQKASLGFNKEAIVVVPLPMDSLSRTKTDFLRNQLQQLSGIKNLSFSFSSPSDNYAWSSDFKFDKSAESTKFSASLKWADANYFKTYHLQLVAGRMYYPSDTTREFVVNETLLKKLGIQKPEDALNKEVNFWNGEIKAQIVGVVKDFHTGSLKREIPAVVLAPRKSDYQIVGIKLEPQKMKETLASIEKIWTGSFPNYIYEYKFLDQKIANFYRQEEQLSTLYKIFAAIAIFISCLGLYGLVSFMAVQRTKEVGIRKVLGASVVHIVYLFSKEFTLLIGIAFLIAAPVGYYFMHQWLQKFAFRIELGIGIFLLAIMASVVIAWLTLSYQAIKAALVNPIKSLKSE